MARKPVRDFFDRDLNHVEPYGSSRFAPLDYTDTGHPETGVSLGRLSTPSYTLHHGATLFREESKTYVPNQIGAPIFSKPETNTLVCAPAGGGKGSTVIVPTLLQYRQSVFVIDPKGENCAIAKRRREELGQTVHVLNPWQLHGLPNAFINPLDIVDPKGRDAISNATLLTDFIVVPSPGGKENFWDLSARALIRAAILYAAAYEQERTLGTVLRLLSQSSDDLKRLFDHMAASEAYEGLLAETGRRFKGIEPRTFSDVLATALAHLDFLFDPIVRESLSRSDIDFSDLTQEPTSVFVIIPTHALDAQARWLRLTLGIAIQAVQKTLHSNRCLFIVDEFPALGYMAAIKTGIATLRGYGADLCLAVQDLGQLQSIYRDDARTIAANCAFKWFSGLSDSETAHYLSEMLGKRTVSVASKTISHGQGGGGSSINTSLTGIALESPDDLMRADKDLAFVLKSGSFPILSRKVSYLDDPELRKHADPNPFYPPPKTEEPAPAAPEPKEAARGGIWRIFGSS